MSPTNGRGVDRIGARLARPGLSPTRAVVVVMRYALRACLPRRRRLGLVLPAAGAPLFGLLAHALTSDTPRSAFASVASAGLFGIIVPIGCLVIGDAVLGAEARAGTLPFTWLSPVPRWTIVAGRWLVGTLVAAVALALSCGLAAVVAGVPGVAPAMVLTVVASSAAYVALFVMLGAVSRRAVVWSLAAVVLGEVLLGGALDGIAQLSPAWLGRSAYGGITGAQALVRTGVPAGWAAVARLAVVTIVWLVIASWRLGHARLAGPSD